MCGILGGNNKEWNYQSAITCMTHRGPDGQKICGFYDFIFAFARLAVVDLSKEAMQPMNSEDGRYAIIFNGEIYDYVYVRRELSRKGYRLKTKSDTEVLLYAFIEWREKVVDYIDGIFAFAVYDQLEHRVYLFRDRCGIKPIYYYYDGKNFAFASEIKAFQCLGSSLRLTLDRTALYDYHTYLYIPEPKSMYNEVKKLPAASYLVFDTTSSQIVGIHKYWKVHLNMQEGKVLSERELNEKAGELHFHLNNAVKRQLVADVPVGTFLSGGVDSSIITAAVKENMNCVTAYSIGFPDRRYDESSYAKKAADMLNIKLKIQRFENGDLIELYDQIVRWYDEPFADTSAYPTYMVSKFAKEDVTVVLTGDGGDELFGGYSRCITCKNDLQKNEFTNKKISMFYLNYLKECKILGNTLDNFLEEDLAILMPRYLYPVLPDRKRLREKYNISKDYDDFWYYRKYYHKDLPPYTRMRYLDFMTYMNGDILAKVDRTSMAVSLEARVPFLDREVIEFAFSLTQNACNPGGELKGLLKRAYADLFPKKFFDRKKQGFSMPFSYLRRQISPQEYLIEDLWKM
ncbi:MAG: asparagine synthase (glutamine-hydrolyzing) [Clostridiales bacterium]|nr:asparagine synthase (glutamine-hydrolyzing) [Clostridiales bacterium]